MIVVPNLVAALASVLSAQPIDSNKLTLGSETALILFQPAFILNRMFCLVLILSIYIGVCDLTVQGAFILPYKRLINKHLGGQT